MIGGDNWYYYQMMQYEQNETQIGFNIGGDVNMFAEKWQLEDVVKMGHNALKYYINQYESMPTCKNLMGESYQNCTYEKGNCCYEKTKEHFTKHKDYMYYGGA